MVAAAGLGAGLTYYIQSDRDHMVEVVRRAVGKYSERIQKTICWFDEISSAKRRKVVEKNEELRVMNLVAQVSGESRADYDTLQECVSNLQETMKFVQKVKKEQERRKIEIQRKKLREEQENMYERKLESSEEEPHDEVKTFAVGATDSEIEEEVEVEVESSSYEEEKDDAIQNNLTAVASIVGSGLQVMSGIFFGSRRTCS